MNERTERKTIPIQDINEASNCASAEPYALMVLGDSMMPEFAEGEIIVVEPSGLVKDGSYVDAYVMECEQRGSKSAASLVPVHITGPGIQLGEC